MATNHEIADYLHKQLKMMTDCTQFAGMTCQNQKWSDMSHPVFAWIAPRYSHDRDKAEEDRWQICKPLACAFGFYIYKSRIIAT